METRRSRDGAAMKKKRAHDPTQSTLSFSGGGLGLRRDLVPGTKQRKVTAFFQRAAGASVTAFVG